MAKTKQITLSQREYNTAREVAFANGILNGKHGTHSLDVTITPKSAHAGKVVCKTCNKHVAFIPKAVIETLYK